jgi:hypothetical protein
VILPPMPRRMRALPVDKRGFPVPWFVHWKEDGEPDFRVVRRSGRVTAIKHNLCWVCGQPKGRYHAFVIGPMCAINRVTSEPPSHLDCAEFAAKACPFLTKPKMRRNEKDMLDEIVPAVGIHLDHNPGVMCLWVTRDYKPFKVDDSFLINLGEPVSIAWWTEGRIATPEEIQAAIDKGLPFLTANAEAEGPESVAELNRYIERFHRVQDAHGTAV